MSARKKTIPPLYAVKHDFVDALEANLQASMMLYHAVTSALDAGAVTNEEIAKILRERAEVWRTATLSEQGR